MISVVVSGGKVSRMCSHQAAYPEIFPGECNDSIKHVIGVSRHEICVCNTPLCNGD